VCRLHRNPPARRRLVCLAAPGVGEVPVAYLVAEGELDDGAPRLFAKVSSAGFKVPRTFRYLLRWAEGTPWQGAEAPSGRGGIKKLQIFASSAVTRSRKALCWAVRVSTSKRRASIKRRVGMQTTRWPSSSLPPAVHSPPPASAAGPGMRVKGRIANPRIAKAIHSPRRVEYCRRLRTYFGCHKADGDRGDREGIEPLKLPRLRAAPTLDPIWLDSNRRPGNPLLRPSGKSPLTTGTARSGQLRDLADASQFGSRKPVR